MATTTAPVIDNFKKNIMGTAQFDLKIGGMRSPQAFNVVPMGKGGSTDVITIQSDKRIGTLNLTTGAGSLSATHSGGAYFAHLAIDRSKGKMTAFQLTPEQLSLLTQAIKGTASAKAGSSGWVYADNSAAALV